MEKVYFTRIKINVVNEFKKGNDMERPKKHSRNSHIHTYIHIVTDYSRPRKMQKSLRVIPLASMLKTVKKSPVVSMSN